MELLRRYGRVFVALLLAFILVGCSNVAKRPSGDPKQVRLSVQ